MPALKPTDFIARVTWIGRVPVEGEAILSKAADRLELGFDGLGGERHAGRTRPSCSRVTTHSWSARRSV